MPNFFALPNEVKQKLMGYFADKPVGTKLKYGFSLLDVPSQNGGYTLKNSYIKLGKDVYALGRGVQAIVGVGLFGKVKYIRSLSTNNTYVVKIMRFGSSDKKLEDIISNEVVSAYDLGLFRDEASRMYGVDNEQKQYMVMINGGTPLDNYMKMYPILNNAVRFDLAIQLCWAVHNLHIGMASRTGNSYAHRDIKPANITVDKTGRVRLIDLGLVASNPNTIAPNFHGSPAYLPNLATLAKHDMTLKEFDILALKRSLYMPSNFLCINEYKEDSSDAPFGFQRLLPKSLLQKTKLFNFIDTSTSLKERVLRKEYYQADSLVLASLLVLARYDLVERYAAKMHHLTLAYAVLGMYFANPEMSNIGMTVLISSSIEAYLMSKKVPRCAERVEQVKLMASLVALGVTNQLNKAMESEVLRDLISFSIPVIKRAAALLWQNGVHKSGLLIQLKNNEALAKKIIQLVFDGDVSEVKERLAKALEAVAKKPQESPCLILPPIGLPKISKSQSTPELAKDTKDKVTVPKKSERLPSLFFVPPQEKKLVVRKTVAEQAPSWKYW